MTTIETAWGVVVQAPDGTVGLNRFAAAADRVARDAFMLGEKFDPATVEITPDDNWSWYRIVGDSPEQASTPYHWLGADAEAA